MSTFVVWTIFDKGSVNWYLSLTEMDNAPEGLNIVIF